MGQFAWSRPVLTALRAFCHEDVHNSFLRAHPNHPLTGLIFKVASDEGSKLALGVSGAENLLGKRHLAAGLPGDAPPGSDFQIAQVPFIPQEDLLELGY